MAALVLNGLTVALLTEHSEELLGLQILSAPRCQLLALLGKTSQVEGGLRTKGIHYTQQTTAMNKPRLQIRRINCLAKLLRLKAGPYQRNPLYAANNYNE